MEKEMTDKILSYCKNKRYEVAQYLINARTIKDIEEMEECFAEAHLNDTEEINTDIAFFSLIFDRIMLFGYVTPCGVALDTKLTYNDNNAIYEVDLWSETIK